MDFTFFEDTPFFTSLITQESVSQVLPIPTSVQLVNNSSILDTPKSSIPSKPPFLTCPCPAPLEEIATEETDTSSPTLVSQPTSVKSKPPWTYL